MNELLDIYEQAMELLDTHVVAFCSGLLVFIAFYLFTKE